MALIRLLNFVKEDVTYTPEKASEIIQKYEKEFSNYQSQVERLYNILQHFSIGDLLEDGGEDKVNNISNAGEKLYDKLHNIYSQITKVGDSFEDDYHGEIYTKCTDLEDKYVKLYNHVHRIHQFAYAIKNVKDDLDEDDLNDLINYKK